MEKELEEIKKTLENFCEKYGVTIKIDTISYGYTLNKSPISPKIAIHIDY